MREGAPQKAESPEIRPTEDVLYDFQVAQDNYRDRPLEEAERTEAYKEMHGALEHFENGEMIHLYDEGRLPTFESLERAVTIAREALETVNDSEADALAKLLSERVTLIKRWCRRYVASVLKFRTLKQAMLRSGETDDREAFQKADEDRRRIHDSLLETLSSLNTLIEKGAEFAKFRQPIAWDPNGSLPEDIAWENPVIFSPEALANRDLIRDWAIVADREEEIKKLTGYPPFPK